MLIPSEALNRERVETRRESRKVRYSPDHKLEIGSENYSV